MRCITHPRRQSILCTPIHLDSLLQLFQSLPIISCPRDKFQLCLSYKFILISNYLPNIYMNSNSNNDHFCLSCSVTPPLKNVYSIWSHVSSFTKNTKSMCMQNRQKISKGHHALPNRKKCISASYLWKWYHEGRRW